MLSCRASFRNTLLHSSLRRRTIFSSRTQALLEDIVVLRDEFTATPTPSSPSTTQSDQQPPQMTETPGQADRQRFRLHWSVDMWRDFNPKTWVTTLTDDSTPIADRLRSFVDTLSSIPRLDLQGTQYWAYHVTRSGFFAAQALLGLAAARAAAGSDVKEGGALTRFEQVARNGWQGPLAEAFLSYYQDYECIKEGKFAFPWDAASLTHRQFNPLYILRKGSAFLSEASETLRRRDRGSPDELWIKSAFLPDYAQSTFHYQSDGWMSSRSADVYETSTETLFVGRQDAMQRTTLVPVSEFMAGKDASQVRALEIAAGTGRFSTFMKDNYPAMDLTITDLSPFYLQAARNNVNYWKKHRAESMMLPGVDNTGTSYMQAAAEELPIADGTYDLVYCLYLFHELPLDVREAAVKEMARVVKPGGMVVLTDSVQLGDRPVYDATLGGFSQFNEPYYEDYLKIDLGALFESAGLECDLKVMSSTTKSLSFRKPIDGGGGVTTTAAADVLVEESLGSDDEEIPSNLLN